MTPRNRCLRLVRPVSTDLRLSVFLFGCNFTPEQMKSIVACANTYHLFCVSVRIEDMEALFACKKGFSIRVNNIRRVVILFDALLENSFIQSRWQNVLGKGRIPAVQGRDTLRFGVNPVFRAVIHQEQHDIGRIQHPKGH